MNYNPLIDIAILGAALLLLVLIIRLTEKPRRFATPEENLEKIKRHQAVRRIMMQDGEYK